METANMSVRVRAFTVKKLLGKMLVAASAAAVFVTSRHLTTASGARSGWNKKWPLTASLRSAEAARPLYWA